MESQDPSKPVGNAMAQAFKELAEGYMKEAKKRGAKFDKPVTAQTLAALAAAEAKRQRRMERNLRNAR